MSALIIPVKKGLTKSIDLLWLLIKIIVPVSILVSLLNHFGIMESLAGFFSPAMALFGLPGEATIALFLSAFVNFYAALGVITTMTLSPQQITVLAVMIGICHELPIETAVSSYTGLRIPAAATLRILTAILAGLLLNLIYTLVGGG